MTNLSKIIESVSEDYRSVDRDDRVLLVDGLNMFITAFLGSPLATIEGIHIGGVLGFLRTLEGIINRFQITRCVVFFDGPKARDRRVKIYPEYKANRGSWAANRVERGNDVDALMKSYQWELELLDGFLATLPLVDILLNDYEADDVIGFLTTEYFTDPATEVIISSSDRDYFQLVTDRVKVYRPVEKKLYDANIISNEFGFIQDNFLLYRMITGDSVDNIKGVHGLGLKTLLKYYPDFKDKKITEADIIQYAQEQVDTGRKLKKYTVMLESKDILDRNRKLMDLSEIDLIGRRKLNIRTLIDDDIRHFDKPKFLQLYHQNKFYETVDFMLNKFLLTFANLSIHGQHRAIRS